jgi:hypothetical protein
MPQFLSSISYSGIDLVLQISPQRKLRGFKSGEHAGQATRRFDDVSYNMHLLMSFQYAPPHYGCEIHQWLSEKYSRWWIGSIF